MPAIAVPLGDRDDQAEVGLNEYPLGQHTVPPAPLVACDLGARGQAELLSLHQSLRRPQAFLDTPGQDHLLLSREEGDLADLLQIHAYGVGAAT